MCCPRQMGIKITSDVFENYPEEVQRALEKFDYWWKENFDDETPVKRSDMPKDIAEALRIVTEAPVPGYQTATGADLCYIIGVNQHLID